MRVTKEFQIIISPEDFAQFYDKVRDKNPPITPHDAAEICRIGEKALRPSAAIASCRCKAPDLQECTLEIINDCDEQTRAEDNILRFGSSIKYLAHASQIWAVVYTIGGGIEALLANPDISGNTEYRDYLNAYATLAMEHISSRVRSEIETEAMESGLGVSAALKPGSLKGWQIAGQRDLFRLTRAAHIGVSISESCMLTPLYSASFLVGGGKEYPEQKIKSLCHECSMYQTCLWRSEEGRA